MKLRIGIMLLLSLVGQAVSAQEQLFYVGTFQSNEEKTLASMEATDGIPETERDHYRNDYFGKLVSEFRYNAFTTYFANEKPKTPEYIPAQIDIVSGNTIRVHYLHAKRGEVVRELSFVEGCYHVLVTQWQFKEYFCKVSR